VLAEHNTRNCLDTKMKYVDSSKHLIYCCPSKYTEILQKTNTWL